MKLFREKPPTPQTKLAVQIETSVCRSCGHAFEGSAHKVTLTGIAREGTGWVGKGTVMSCPYCGAAASAIRKEIPIVASEFRCPICHKHEDLEYQIAQLNMLEDQKDGFEFVVEISCKPCTRKRTIRKFKDSLTGTTEVNVNPEDITFK